MGGTCVGDIGRKPVRSFVSLVNRQKRVECGFAEISGIVEAPVAIQAGDGGHLVVTEPEIEDRKVLFHPLEPHGFWNDCSATPYAPPEHHLCGSAAMAMARAWGSLPQFKST